MAELQHKRVVRRGRKQHIPYPRTALLGACGARTRVETVEYLTEIGTAVLEAVP